MSLIIRPLLVLVFLAPTSVDCGGDDDPGPVRPRRSDAGIVSGTGCTRDDQCNDGDNCTEDFCAGGFCNETPVVTGDGDGDRISPILLRDMLGSCARDCNNSNAEVPSEEWHRSPASGRFHIGYESWDWNCSGEVERRYGAVTGDCRYDRETDSGCPTQTREGWRGSNGPGCGQTGVWAVCEVQGRTRCSLRTLESRVQECR